MIKQYLETNIEYHKLVLNRAKNELHKEKLKVSKVTGEIGTTKVIKNNNINIKNEMFFIKKEVDEVIILYIKLL